MSKLERRKIERMIRRLEKQQRTSSDHMSEGKVSDQLSKLREDLEYVRVSYMHDIFASVINYLLEILFLVLSFSSLILVQIILLKKL